MTAAIYAISISVRRGELKKEIPEANIVEGFGIEGDGHGGDWDKSSLSKFKKIEVISSIFSDHNAIRLDINYRVKNTYSWKLDNTLLNNETLLKK